MTSKNSPVIKPQQALEDYLSALLSPGDEDALMEEVTSSVAPQPVAVQPGPAAPTTLDPRQKEALQRTLLSALPRQVSAPAGDSEPAPEQPVLADRQEPAQPPAQAAGADTDASDVRKEAPDEWLDNGRPYWAQERFECLLFSVAGLKLAVPLVCLGGIHAVRDPDEIRPLPGIPDWFVGLMQTGQGNLRVVDTARWVMPERDVGSYRGQMQYVIRINGCDWGLSCDGVDKSFSLNPEQVRWRTLRSKRPWLAGTLIEQMCALVDVDTFRRLLQESERRNRLR